MVEAIDTGVRKGRWLESEQGSGKRQTECKKRDISNILGEKTKNKGAYLTEGGERQFLHI